MKLAKVVALHPATVTRESSRLAGVMASRSRHPTAAAPPRNVAPGLWAIALQHADGDPARIIRVSWAHLIVD